MQIRLRDVPMGKLSPIESKTISSWFSHDRQNIRFWAQARDEHHYRPLSLKRGTVWCALGGNDIIGVNWFEDAA